MQSDRSAACDLGRRPAVARLLAPALPLLAVLAGWPGTAQATESATAAMRRSHEQITKLLRRKTAAGSPQDRQVKQQMKVLVNDFLDFRELAKRALAKHWDGLPPAKRDEFVSVLKELIERNYIKQLRTNLDYELVFRPEERNGAEVTVRTMVRFNRNGRPAETPIDYKLQLVAGKWMAFDLITDEVSLVRNYRSQFNRIIQKESFDALLKKMQRKLAETPS